MADSRYPHVRKSAARREWIPYVIEDPASCRQRPSCDLNQLLTLRGNGRSVTKGAAVVRANDRHQV